MKKILYLYKKRVGGKCSFEQSNRSEENKVKNISPINSCFQRAEGMRQIMFLISGGAFVLTQLALIGHSSNCAATYNVELRQL
jgi:hypothetical protein